MKSARILGVFTLAATLATLWACGDDEMTGGIDAALDAGPLDASARDSSSPFDAGGDAAGSLDGAPDAPVVDAGHAASDAASDAAVDTITRSSGPGGVVNIDEGYVVAEFYVGATIVRDSAVPECVTLLRQGDATVDAGSITLGGEVVGKEGGLSEEGTFGYDADEGGYFFEGDGNGIFPVGEGYTLSFALNGTASFPAASIAALATPNSDNATFTQPLLGVERTLALKTDTDFVFAWTPPAEVAGQSISVELNAFENPDTHVIGAVFCNFPAEAGAGRIPAGLLAAIREKTGNATGILTADLGGGALLGGSEAAYLVRARRGESTNWASLSTEPNQIGVSWE